MSQSCATPETLRLGDYGTEIVLEFTYKDRDGIDQVLSIANADRLEYTFSRVLGPADATSLATVFTRTAGLLTDGSDGLAVYRLQPGDPVAAATFEIEGLARIPGPPEKNFRSTLARIKFEASLSTHQSPTSAPAMTFVVPAVSIL